MSETTTHRFRCTCGKVNQFKVPPGKERDVKVRCAACKSVCRMTVPASLSNEQRIQEVIEAAIARSGVLR